MTKVKKRAGQRTANKKPSAAAVSLAARVKALETHVRELDRAVDALERQAKPR